jgi:hypothetical protein
MSTEQEIAPVEPQEPEVVEPGSTPEPSAAAPAAAADTPSGGEEAQPSETKTYTKDELERIVAKERARERRKLERLMQQQQPAQAPQVQATGDGEPAKPSISQFQTVEEYDAAMSAWADKRAEYKESVKEKQQAELRQKQAQHEILAAHEDREDSARDKYPDYDTVVGNQNLPITVVMADAIRMSDVGPDVAYHLGQNLQEAARIAKLPPLLQVKEIGKLEVKLASAPPAREVSSAPPPIRPLRGSAQNLTAAPSDSDPIDVWLKKRNAQIMAKQAAHRR